MMNNGTDIRKAMRAAKQSPKKQDGLKGVIYDQRGQYAFPGQVTKIQGDAYGTLITMAGVPYPMYGEDDLGYGQMMYPGMEYQFAGQHVTEYPMPAKQYFNAYDGIPMAQDGRIQATPTYASGKEQNTLESMSIDRRNYEQALADQLAQKQLADAKLAMNVAGLVFYPAAAAASAVDFSKGNYGQGLAGLVPFVGPASKANTARNILNQASRNLLTKSYNAGIPYKLAAPIIKGAKKSIMYGANAANVEDAYSAFNEHAYEEGGSNPPGTSNVPVVSKKQAYQNAVKNNYQKYLESVNNITPYTESTKDQMNCIHGVCLVLKGTGAKNFMQEYTGNQTFKDAREKEGYYQVDPNNEGFEVGDIIQYSKTKEHMAEAEDNRYKGKVNPVNAKELVPAHAKVILDKYVDKDGITKYKIGHNSGTDNFTVSDIDETTLLQHANKGLERHGAKFYEGLIVNRYDPEYVEKKRKEDTEELKKIKGENPYTSMYKTPAIKELHHAHPEAHKLLDYYKKNYQKIGKTADMPPAVLDKLFHNQVGIFGQETNFGEEGFLKELVPDALLPTARHIQDTFRTSDDWITDYWNNNADDVKSKYMTKEQFANEIKARNKLSSEAREYLRYEGPRSKGIFQQKDLSKRGRVLGSDFDNAENQFLSSMYLAIDNYHLLKKKYPDMSNDELVDLTTLMHNAPSKALTPEYVNYYLKNNNIDYVNKVKNLRGDLLVEKKPSYVQKLKQDTAKKVKPEEIEAIKKFLLNQAGSISNKKVGGWLNQYATGGWLDHYEPGGGDPSLPNIEGHYQKGGTKIHTDKAAYEKAHKAEMDSLNKYKDFQKYIKDGWIPVTQSQAQIAKNYVRDNPKNIQGVYYHPASGPSSSGWNWESEVINPLGNPPKKPVIHNVYEKPVYNPSKGTPNTLPNKQEAATISADYLPMIQAGIPEMISREPEIIASPTPRPSSTNNRIAWRMDPETRKMVPVYLEGKQKVKEGKRLYNKYIPTSTMGIPEDFVPQFEPDGNKDVVSKQMGGWLDELDEEYRRGGGVNPLMKSRSKRATTKKNIQSSINKLFLRNKDLFGPAGKNIYDPNSKYQEGGIPMAQSGLIAAPTTGSVPVSTKAPVNPVNPESTMGLLEFIKHRWDTRDKGPGDWDMGYVDPVTGNYVNTGVTPFDIMLPVQAVSGAKQAVSAVNKLTNSEKLIPKTSTYNKLKSNITNIKELGKGVKETFKEANKTRKFLKENWQDIKQIPDQYKTALKELTSEEGLKRLKELGVDDPDDFINYLKNIKLNTTTEGSHFFPVGPGSVNINPKQVKKLKETILPLSSQKVSIDHELGHAIQYYLENKGKTFNRLTDLDIDAVEALYPHVKENVNKFIEKTRGLTYDEAKKMAENLSESSANYLFRNKREPLSHLRETKRAMVDKGVISNIHETVTPEHIQEFILKGGDKDRILSFLQQTSEAKQTLSKLLNRTPAIIPIGLGVSAISENQKKLGGWLDNLD